MRFRHLAASTTILAATAGLTFFSDSRATSQRTENVSIKIIASAANNGEIEECG